MAPCGDCAIGTADVLMAVLRGDSTTTSPDESSAIIAMGKFCHIAVGRFRYSDAR